MGKRKPSSLSFRASTLVYAKERRKPETPQEVPGPKPRQRHGQDSSSSTPTGTATGVCPNATPLPSALSTLCTLAEKGGKEGAGWEGLAGGGWLGGGAGTIPKLNRNH